MSNDLTNLTEAFNSITLAEYVKVLTKQKTVTSLPERAEEDGVTYVLVPKNSTPKGYREVMALLRKVSDGDKFAVKRVGNKVTVEPASVVAYTAKDYVQTVLNGHSAASTLWGYASTLAALLASATPCDRDGKDIPAEGTAFGIRVTFTDDAGNEVSRVLTKGTELNALASSLNPNRNSKTQEPEGSEGSEG
jgi:hypothetical protein